MQPSRKCFPNAHESIVSRIGTLEDFTPISVTFENDLRNAIAASFDALSKDVSTRETILDALITAFAEQDIGKTRLW